MTGKGEPLGAYGEEVSAHYAVPGKLVDQSESFVFRVDGKDGQPTEVWKLYPNLNLNTIQRYQKLTELIRHTVDGQGGSIQTPDGSIRFDFQWKVSPIKEVRLHKGFPLAVSDWVEGEHVQDLIQKQEQNGQLDHPLQRISAVDKGLITDALDGLSSSVNSFLRMRGDRSPLIWVTPLNVKPVDSQLVVTDLCAAVTVMGS